MAKIKPKTKIAKATKSAKPAAAPAKAAAPKVAKAVKPVKAAKPAPAPKKVAKAKLDRGEGAYAVQAKKMKALIDTLREATTALEEAKVIKEMTRRGFPLHPRTLLREVERVRILGHAVERVVGENGIVYSLSVDPRISEAFASLEAARKELRKSGSPLEKQIAAAIKTLKN
ncbi:MAG: hypothetical protein H6686_00325 [Fibrobacteria bacterium]|nr:hypothetical protein [Fibrobacteria bacterium]